MKIKFLSLSMIALLVITSLSCSNDDETATTPTVTPKTTSQFKATIGTENFTADATLITI